MDLDLSESHVSWPSSMKTALKSIFFAILFLSPILVLGIVSFSNPKNAEAQSTPGCTYTPNSTTVGSQISVTSVNGLAGEIRMAGALWPQPATGSVSLGTISANQTQSFTIPTSSTPQITPGDYAVRGPFGVLCTTTGSGTSLAITSTPPSGTPGCTYTPNSTTVGSQISVTSVNGLAGEIRMAGALWPQPATGSVSLGTISANQTQSFTIPTSSTPQITPGDYAVRGPFGVLCTTTGSGTSLAITSTSTPPPTTGSVECPNLTTTRPTTAREAYDRVWLTGICNNNADQVYFGWGQTATIVDSIYSLLWAKSQLHPESDGVTAGTGAVASTGKLVATMYNPPVSGVNYLAGEFRKLNPVKDAYAQQGVGYDALAPVQTVWEGFRNISYVGFVIVFVIIGFMIMFRAHISPQAVATLQDSLPRIVVALILVTFSYAIAGLMIDIMFLVLNVALAALPVTDSANIVFTKSVFGVVTSSWKSTFGAVSGAVGDLINATVDFGGLEKILGWLGGSLAAIIIGIAMLFVMFKVFITLLIAYATIIILTISAPFFFLFQALPGNNSAQTWFKQMAANISVFPAVAIMFILAGYLGNISALGGTTEVFGSQQVAKFPLLAGDINPAVLGQLVGIGLLLMTPGAADMVKSTIGAKSQGAGAMGAAAAGALSAGAGVVGAPFKPAARETHEATEEGLRRRFAAGKSGVTRPAIHREGAKERLDGGSGPA